MNKKNLELGKKPSAIRELFEFCNQKKKELGEGKVFDFSIGNPNIPTSKFVTDILTNLLINEDPVKLHGYTSAPGDMDVRNKVASYLNETYNAKLDGNLIFMTCGAAAGLAICFNALLEKDDEVIVYAPYFPEYKVFVEAAHGKLVALDSDNDLLPDLKLLEKSINEKTRLLIINSPNNPSGMFYDEKMIIALSNILKKKEIEYCHPIYLLSDEPYRELLYVNEKYPFVTNYYDDSLVCYSFSKSLSLPGERIGYIAINPQCDDAQDVFYSVAGAARSLGYISAPSLFQYMVKDVLDDKKELEKHYQFVREGYKTNRDLLYKSLTGIGYELIYPYGAFYIYMKALEKDEEHFSEIAKEYNLLIVPSTSFGSKGYVRLCYAVKKETILNSVEAFKKLYKRYQK
ncbi:MAG: pyridoxal phosphate-dependent aminotransferase [Bacilli bacterium]|nr:pyridoxal phosphate-dependent aminotransferase [Bacilli bacterium]